jgi:hypothetical protein
VRLFSFLIEKSEVAVELEVEGDRSEVAIPVDGGFDAAVLPAAQRFGVAAASPAQDWPRVPLIRLAHGRSGDKGDKANVGVIARKPEYLEWISAWLTPERVGAHFAHNRPSRVERFDLPGCNAINFLLHDVLGGGGMASLRTDNLAKAYAQVLLVLEVPVPPAIAAAL